MRILIAVCYGTICFAIIAVIALIGVACIFSPMFAWAIFPSHPILATIVAFLLMISTQIVAGLDW